MNGSLTESHLAASPPRIVAISGILFSALSIASLVPVRLAVPADPKDAGIWLADPAYRNWVDIALNLAPFTGIALVMLFAWVAVSRGLLETSATPDRLAASSATFAVGRAMAYAFMTTFGVKMGACGEAPSIDDGTTSGSFDLRSSQQP